MRGEVPRKWGAGLGKGNCDEIIFNKKTEKKLSFIFPVVHHTLFLLDN